MSMRETLLGSGEAGAPPTFLCPSALPLDPETWKRATFRERIKAFTDNSTRGNGDLPPLTLLSVYAIFGTIWWYLWSHFFMDHSQDMLSEFNMRRFIVYNGLHGVVGMGATCGLLGFRFKIAVLGPALHFLTPGTICSPLLPELVRKVPGSEVPAKRSIAAVVSYALLVASLFFALTRPEGITTLNLMPVYVLMCVCICFDFSILQALRVEQTGYMLVCLAFPDWIHGCQTVQLALWMWAGVSKVGPWWKYVIPFICKDNLLTMVLPKDILGKLLFKNLPDEKSPSELALVMSYLGMALEIVFPLCCCAQVGGFINMIGYSGMFMYHIFIASCFAFASVQEWNYFNMILTIFLFKNNGFQMPQSFLLLCFLFVVSFAVPLVGQAYPTLVPFLAAYRPYMGNWRFSWYIVKKTALPKHEKLKTWANPIAGKDGEWFYGFFGSLGKQGVDMMPYFDYLLTQYLVLVPAYRPLIPVVEKLLDDNGWNIEDVEIMHSEPYQNQVFGWSLGTGWITTRECVREAYNDICGFDEKEMYIVNFEPVSPLGGLTCLGDKAPFGWKMQYRCYDITKGPMDAQIHGSIPYQELEKFEPTTCVLDGNPEYMQCGGQSIKGTFLSTYY